MLLVDKILCIFTVVLFGLLLVIVSCQAIIFVQEVRGEYRVHHGKCQTVP